MSDDNAVSVSLKSAVSGIAGTFALGQFNLKIPSAANCQIQTVVGFRQAAAFRNTVNGRGSDTQTKLNAGGHHSLIRGRNCTRTNNVLIQQVVKFGSPFGISRSVHIGDVVGNHVNIRLLSQHSGCAYL